MSLRRPFRAILMRSSATMSAMGSTIGSSLSSSIPPREAGDSSMRPVWWHGVPSCRTQPGCWSVRIETRDGIVQRVLVRPAPDYTGTLIEVESLEAAHAYLMATPTGSPWVTP